MKLKEILKEVFDINALEKDVQNFNNLVAQQQQVVKNINVQMSELKKQKDEELKKQQIAKQNQLKQAKQNQVQQNNSQLTNKVGVGAVKQITPVSKNI